MKKLTIALAVLLLLCGCRKIEEDPVVTTESQTEAPELVKADDTPEGDEPDGLRFTGLRADCGDHGYLLLFRECSEEKTHKFHLPALKGKKLTKLAGEGNGTIDDTAVIFTAEEKRSFALFRYE